jgi:hypothetical protein|tara:strand:- start:42 stop:215 length:174 start_codon:yes stop_codon:yes gene_type:complete
MKIKTVKKFTSPTNNTFLVITDELDDQYTVADNSVGNKEYELIQQWVAEGNTIEELE